MLFTVEEQRPTQYRVGKLKGTTPEYMLQQLAEEAGEKVLGKSFFEPGFNRGYTVFRNLADRATAADLTALAGLLTDWLDNIEPQFAAIEGKVGYNIRPGVHRPITTADGRQHSTRLSAATHVLRLRLTELRPALQNATVRAICNANKYGRHEGDEKPFHFDSGFTALVTGGQFSASELKPANVTKVRDALAAMAEAKATPVENL